jgi:hypothetical protein
MRTHLHTFMVVGRSIKENALEHGFVDSQGSGRWLCSASCAQKDCIRFYLSASSSMGC